MTGDSEMQINIGENSCKKSFSGMFAIGEAVFQITRAPTLANIIICAC